MHRINAQIKVVQACNQYKLVEVFILYGTI